MRRKKTDDDVDGIRAAMINVGINADSKAHHAHFMAEARSAMDVVVVVDDDDDGGYKNKRICFMLSNRANKNEKNESSEMIPYV